MSDPTPPPPTRTPGTSIRADEVPVPPYVIQMATDAYQQGYIFGWKLAAVEYQKLEQASTAKTPARPNNSASSSNSQDGPAPPDAETIDAGHEFEAVGKWLYRWGYIDGWEASVATYKRHEQRQA